MISVTYDKYKKLKTSIFEAVKYIQDPAAMRVMADMTIESLVMSGNITEQELLEAHDVCGFLLICAEYGSSVVEDTEFWTKVLREEVRMMELSELSDGILLKKLSENPTLFIK